MDFAEEEPDIPAPSRAAPPVPGASAPRRQGRPLPIIPDVALSPRPLPTNPAEEKRKGVFFQRGKVLQELLLTEEIYVVTLRKIIDVYKKPLLQPNSPLPAELAADIVLKIFSNIEEIYQLNSLLLDAMKKVFPNKDQISGETSLGKTFLQLASFLKLYSTYCENHSTAAKILQEHTERNQKFQAFLQKAKSSTDDASLPDLLSRPVQRICKYPLLFRELLKATPHEHEDYKTVEQTLGKVEQVAMDVNKWKDNLENFKKFHEFQENVIGCTFPPSEQIVPTLIYEEKLIVLTEQKQYPRHTYLFSNCIILTKSVSGPQMSKEQHTNTFDLKQVIETRANETDKCTFELDLDSEKIIFICPSVASRTLWMNKLNATLAQKTDTKNTSGFLNIINTSIRELPPNSRQHTEGARRASIPEELPRLVAFLSKHLMEAPHYVLIHPNTMERQEFLREVVIGAFVNWLFEVGVIFYFLDPDAQLKGVGAWVDPTIPLVTPLSVKMATVLDVWTRFSYSRASVLKSVMSGVEHWIAAHKPVDSAYIFLVAGEIQTFKTLFETIRAKAPDTPMWSYNFDLSYKTIYDQLGFNELQCQEFKCDAGKLPVAHWQYKIPQ